MNRERRKQINEVIKKLGSLARVVDELQTDISDIQTDEENYLDAMPENLLGSEKAQAADAAISELQDAVDAVEGIVDVIEEIRLSLEAAAE